MCVFVFKKCNGSFWLVNSITRINSEQRLSLCFLSAGGDSFLSPFYRWGSIFPLILFKSYPFRLQSHFYSLRSTWTKITLKFLSLSETYRLYRSTRTQPRGPVEFPRDPLVYYMNTLSPERGVPLNCISSYDSPRFGFKIAPRVGNRTLLRLPALSTRYDLELRCRSPILPPQISIEFACCGPNVDISTRQKPWRRPNAAFWLVTNDARFRHTKYI